jgi:hypothetical protein
MRIGRIRMDEGKKKKKKYEDKKKKKAQVTF